MCRKKKSPSLRGSGLKWTPNKSENPAGTPSPSLRGSGLKSSSPLPATAAPFRLPLYEGVDWNRPVRGRRTPRWCQSPSLRGSGLKCVLSAHKTMTGFVSLFTREWIEIPMIKTGIPMSSRLPLYEGVDWNCDLGRLHTGMWSPSLRGSGLKSPLPCHTRHALCVSLFTREWIEIPPPETWFFRKWRVSLFTREWIEIRSSCIKCKAFLVSLFTREWIEIQKIHLTKSKQRGLPLYEGVDWNSQSIPLGKNRTWSPSLRGSGLK